MTRLKHPLKLCKFPFEKLFIAIVTVFMLRSKCVTMRVCVVGRWRSADGRVFYLALGGRFDAAGHPVGK